MKLCIFLALLFIFKISAHEEKEEMRNVQWDYDDPRWDSDIPNWWEEENFVPPIGPTEEKSRKFWVDQGQSFLKKKVKQKQNLNKARNLVILIADGMGISTQMAARSYAGDVKSELSFEKFPYSGLSKIYCLNYQVPDSACTATAILSGIKNNFNVLSLTGNVNVRNCTAQQDKANHVDSIFKYAQDAGKSTGFVTNTRVTHATPAAAYAKSSSRYWESNEGTPEGCDDIAVQMVHGEIGSKLDVVLGGGRRSFVPNTWMNDKGERGLRTDNRNLINEYMQRRWVENVTAEFVQNRDELLAINANVTEKILGIFAHNHMQYKLLAEELNQPTLKEMTAKALEVLKKNDKGYVLLVEGGRIDHAHHETRARLALHETIEFDKTIEVVKENTDEEDTLIVVTADHSHVFTVGGYTPRGRNILGVGDFARKDWMWFFSLNYANGPGHNDHVQPNGERRNPRGMNYMNPLFRQPATVLKEEETHSGEDVGVYAIGPFAHIFSGVYEQSYIAHAMAYITCLGPDDFEKHPQCTDQHSNASFNVVTFWVLILLFLVTRCCH